MPSVSLCASNPQPRRSISDACSSAQAGVTPLPSVYRFTNSMPPPPTDHFDRPPLSPSPADTPSVSLSAWTFASRTDCRGPSPPPPTPRPLALQSPPTSSSNLLHPFDLTPPSLRRRRERRKSPQTSATDATGPGHLPARCASEFIRKLPEGTNTGGGGGRKKKNAVH